MSAKRDEDPVQRTFLIRGAPSVWRNRDPGDEDPDQRDREVVRLTRGERISVRTPAQRGGAQ